MRPLIVLPLLMALVLACSAPLTEGYVAAKEYQPQHEYLWLMPIPHTICTTSAKGASSCITTYSYIPVPLTEPEHYVVTIKNCASETDKCKSSSLRVSRERYADVEIGQWFKR